MMDPDKFCALCGQPLVPVVEVYDKYDRKTGDHIKDLYLTCPEWRKGPGYLGVWKVDNGHDRIWTPAWKMGRHE